MATLTTFYREVQERLEVALPTFWGPAEHLPTEGGQIVPCAVLWPTPGTVQYRADGRTAARRVESLRLVIVGPTVLDVLEAVDTARQALVGQRMRASARGGPVTESGFIPGDPTPEPGTDPVRVSIPIQLTAVTKETR